jgi:hypothetical protein
MECESENIFDDDEDEEAEEELCEKKVQYFIV